MFSSPLNLPLLQSHALVRSVEFHEELDSTNSRALVLATQREQPLPTLILAERQTAGRGRGENRWWAASGSLTFSLLLEADANVLPPQRWPLVSLVMALAVGSAIRERVGQAEVALKWPNDVFLSGRKVCGILVETVAARPGRLVVGVGVNVNNSFAAAPPELTAIATSLCDATGCPHDRTELLADILTHFAADWPQIGASSFSLAERWRPHCFLTGRRVTIQAGPRITVGKCQGIDSDGALILLTETGRERCVGGVVAKIE